MSAKILVAVDFSSITPLVVSWATSLARSRRASLILLHVQEPMADTAAGAILFPMPLDENPGVRRALDTLTPDDGSINFERRLLLGPAPERILEVAGQEQVELIVMGSHGRGWLGQMLMGSVVQIVMRRAPCPVLVVSPPCCCPAPADPTEEQSAASGP